MRKKSVPVISRKQIRSPSKTFLRMENKGFLPAPREDVAETLESHHSAPGSHYNSIRVGVEAKTFIFKVYPFSDVFYFHFRQVINGLQKNKQFITITELLKY